MNKEKWNSLPRDVQEAATGVSDRKKSEVLAGNLD